MTKEKLGLGVIGAGGFGLFAMQQFLQLPNIHLIAIASTHREAADQVARRFGATHLETPEELLKLPGLDIVYISTPPFLHHKQALLALEAGKHVICEKPLALNLLQAEEMIGLAKKNDLLLVTNLMQRYNPIYDRISELFKQKPLGEFLHGYFENYASDENLPPEHWFWDRSKSGGIFVEHGVHFFDMFEGWLGKGKVLSAQRNLRPGTDLEEQVQCSVLYNNSMVNFYHGFHQAGTMDRQEFKLVFERGEVVLHEWIPSSVNIFCIASEKDTRILMDIFPNSSLSVIEHLSSARKNVTARHKKFEVYQKIKIRHDNSIGKMELYCYALKQFFLGNIEWINNREFPRRITIKNSFNSLRMGVEANAAMNCEPGIILKD
jgi:predicted dehydrogenase